MEQISPETYSTKSGHDDRLLEYFETENGEYAALAEQSERVSAMLQVFTDEKLMSTHAIDVTRLQSLVDIVRDASQPAALRQDTARRIMDYLTDPMSPAAAEDVDYMFALWSDLPKIDAVASRYQRRLEEHDSDVSRQALEKLCGEANITPDDWHSLRVGVDVPEIVQLSQHVNVESILTRAALVLDRVATASEYNSEVLQDILEIETVYAPLLDMLGLHACEAILRHHTEKARLMATGREDIVQAYDAASDYIESVRADGLVNDVIEGVMGIDLQQHDFGFIVANEETPYGSKSYFSAIRYQDDNVRFISRIKSPASYAHKMLYNDEYESAEPQDVYAGTVVVANIEEMLRVFKDVMSNIESSDSCELVTAPSKNHPVHIKGKQAYIAAVKSGLGEEFEGQLDIAPVSEDVEEPFQVLKVTFTLRRDGKTLPVEIQFQTQQDRARARLGGASHLCFKGKNGSGLPGNIPGNSDDLRKVNNRKWAMLEGGEAIYLEHEQTARNRQVQDILELQRVFLEAFERGNSS